MTLSAGSADGAIIATDQDASAPNAHYQIIKLAFGALNTFTLVTTSAGLPADVVAVVPGTGATNLGKAEDAVHASGDTGVAVLAVRKDTAAALAGADGDYAVLEVDANGALHVTQAALDSATDDVAVEGMVAHDAADSKKPVKIGLKAETSPKGLTLVVDGDVTDAFADADGLQMVKLNTSLADIVSERVSNTDGASTAFTNFGAVASTRNYVSTICIFNSSASAVYVDFRDGTAGSILWTVPCPATGGVVISSPVPLFKTTANTALAFDPSAATSTLYISVSGFQSKAG